jgi:vacuolar-type H+-ATPase subunit D/Vma8
LTEEAIALFRANSTHLNEQKKRTRRKRATGDNAVSLPSPRDPLLNYKKPQLVMRFREAQQQIQTLERQLGTLAEACLQRDARVVELEAKLAELEPYRSFVEQVRQRIR